MLITPVTFAASLFAFLCYFAADVACVTAVTFSEAVACVTVVNFAAAVGCITVLTFSAAVALLLTLFCSWFCLCYSCYFSSSSCL